MTYKILIVDDNELNLSLIKRILEIEKYMVFTANNGIEALQIIENSSPDIIFLDVMMPDINGYELCEKIRMPPYGITSPVIMLTAMDSESERTMAKNSGANGVWSKPFDVDLLTLRIKELINENEKYT